MTPESLYRTIKELIADLRREKIERFKRSVSIGDYFTEREERAALHGFGEGTTCYDNVLIIGDVQVGRHTWIGPGVILDGSGGLSIGDHCTISAGVHIYSHSTLERSLSLGKKPTVYQKTSIGSGVYLGPNAIIEMGVDIGDRCVVGALSLVRSSIPTGSKAVGCPAKVIGAVDPL